MYAPPPESDAAKRLNSMPALPVPMAKATARYLCILHGKKIRNRTVKNGMKGAAVIDVDIMK